MSAAGTRKPVLGALYYIKHEASGKYVHPQDGGKDIPKDYSPLVYHQPLERNDLKFYFWTFSGRTFLKHYSSQRKVAVQGRGYGNNENLIIVPSGGDPDLDDSIEVTLHDGLAFLHGTGSNSYVHPHGGLSSPSDGTRLVMYNGWSPSHAVSFVPAEQYEVLETHFDLSSMDRQPGTIVNSTYSEQSNYGTNDLKYTFRTKYEQSITNTVEITLSMELGVSISTTVTAGIKLVEASTTVSYSFTFGMSKTTGTSTTQGLENEHTLEYSIPPGKTVRVYSQTSRKNGTSIPYWSKIRNLRGHEHILYGTANIDMFFNQKGYLYEFPNGQTPSTAPREVNMTGV